MFVEAAEVAGVDPSRFHERAAVVLLAQVASEHARPGHRDHADLVGRAVAEQTTLGIEPHDARARIRQRPPHRTGLVRDFGVAHGVHARGLGHAVHLEHRQLHALFVSLDHCHRNRRAAARHALQAAHVGAVQRHLQRSGEHGGHAAEQLRPIALHQLPHVGYGVRVAPTGGAQHHHMSAVGEWRQALCQRPTHVEQRQAEQHALTGPGKTHEAQRPGLRHLVGVRVAHQLRRAGGAAGVEVARGIVVGRQPAAREVRGGLRVEVRIEVVGLEVGSCGAAHDQHGRQRGHRVTHRGHLVPQLGACFGTDGHQHARPCGAQDVGDLAGRQQRVHRVCHTDRLRAEQGREGLRQQRQQQAHHLAAADAERMERIGRLGDARDELPVRQRQRRLVGAGVLQEVQRRRLRVERGTELQCLESAVRGHPLGIGRAGLEGRHLRHRLKTRQRGADQLVEHMGARGSVHAGLSSGRTVCQCRDVQRSSSCRFILTSRHSSASGNGSLVRVIGFHPRASSAFSAVKSC